LHSHPATDERKVNIHLRRLSVIFHFKRILECPSVDNTISEFFDHLKADAFELLPSMDDTWKINHLFIRLVASNIWTAIVGGDAAAKFTTFQDSNNAPPIPRVWGIFPN